MCKARHMIAVDLHGRTMQIMRLLPTILGVALMLRSPANR